MLRNMCDIWKSFTSGFNWDTQKAAESVRKLPALNPKKVAAGHAEPFEAPDLVEQLLKAADAIDGKGISTAA